MASPSLGNVTAIIGTQWGDEGKGKLVDILAEKYDWIVRATGGANAGHTIYVNNKKFVFHQVPSGALQRKTKMVIGNGCVIHIPSLIQEMKEIEDAGVKLRGRLFISDRAHLVLDYHKKIDVLQEAMKGKAKIGTTGRGIGPAYSDKINRMGIRVGELKFWKDFEKHYQSNFAYHKKMYVKLKHDDAKELVELHILKDYIEPYMGDTTELLAQEIKKKKRILLEGANATMLDIDHGTYPFVTSSNASIGGIITGTGIPPRSLTSIIGIVKAYTTRVGAGPFPSELSDKTGEYLREKGGEYGATTGRPRRCGWFDVVVVRHAILLNGITHINLTKLDVLTGLKKIKICTGYGFGKSKPSKKFPQNLDYLDPELGFKPQYIELPSWNESIEQCKKFKDLPKNAQKYVKTLEKLLGTRITFIGVGYNRNQLISV